MLDITEVALRTGLPASTLRYYEEKGLITSTGRHGLHRIFSPETLQRLALIALGKNGGFSLDEIREMFGANGEPEINREQLLSKADELEKVIQNLSAVRDGLRHVAHCPAPDHLQCPAFQKLLRLATHRRVKPVARHGKKIAHQD